MKTIKYFVIIFAVLMAIIFSTCAILSKQLPQGKVGSEAENLSTKLLQSINKPAWDSTKYAKWTFRGNHHYLWDKNSNLAQVSWKNFRVLLNPNQISGICYEGQTELKGEKKDKALQKAWNFWCNDMFWFVAPYKINDPGTSRSIISHEDGDRLKITYDSGGVTPGDSYVWILDGNGKPIAYEMYVNIIPVKGLHVTWEGWKTLSTGAMISTSHKMAKMNLEITEVAGGQTLQDIGLDTDIWSEIRTLSD
jgi:hypothetical protein